MIERLKTLALTGLVILSLLLSLGIWSTTPQYEAVDSPQYGNNSAISEPATQRTLGNVTAPREFVLHFGEKKHTVLFPGQSSYQAGMNLLRQASFFDLQITTDYGEKEWETLVNKEESLQVDFDVPVHASTLDNAELLKFDSRFDPSMVCQSLYLFKVADDSDLRALFYSGAPDNRMYLAHVILPKAQYSQLFAHSQAEPGYELFGQLLSRNYYLPAQPQQMTTYSTELSLSPSASDWVDSFFVDKSLTRKVLERDNSQIVTDGSRSVRVDANNHLIEYRNLNLDNSQNVRSDSDYAMQQALDFVDEHGGFSGQVLLHRDASVHPENSVQSYDFRQYWNGYPLLGNVPSVLVNVSKDQVASLQRSQYNLNNKWTKQGTVTVLSGQQLMKAIDQTPNLDRNLVTDVYLAYLSALESDKTTCVLRPVYVVEEAGSGQRFLFDAVTGTVLPSEEVPNGLE